MFTKQINLITRGLRAILNVNKIVKTLILSDVLLTSSMGLISPIMAVFYTEKISGGSLVVVGIAGAIYLATKSIIQIPLGILIDKTAGEKFDFWLAFGGSLICTFSAFLYIFAKIPMHIYIIEFLFGLGAGISHPAWMGLFTRNMDKGKESFIWSLEMTPTELGSAFTAAIGAVLAEKIGFNNLFVLVGTISLFGTLLLYAFYDEIVD